jgi:hypothetical protein
LITKIVIGDRYRDGHGMFDTFMVDHNVELPTPKMIKDTLKVDFSLIASEYSDNSVPNNIVDIVLPILKAEPGIDAEDFFYDDNGTWRIGDPYSHLWLYLILAKHVNSKLIFSVIDEGDHDTMSLPGGYGYFF